MRICFHILIEFFYVIEFWILTTISLSVSGDFRIGRVDTSVHIDYPPVARGVGYWIQFGQRQIKNTNDEAAWKPTISISIVANFVV